MAYGLGYAGGYVDVPTDPLGRVLEIEFDAGTWTNVIEDAVSVSCRRGRNKESGAFETGTMVFTLRNDDRTYDPDNNDGIWYGKLRPNRRVRFRAVYGAENLAIFQGYVDKISQDWGGPNDATATFDCSDLFKLLNRVELPTSVYSAEVADDGPSHWWRLDEPAGSTAVVDSIGGATATVDGNVVFGAAGMVTRDPGSSMNPQPTVPGPGALRAGIIPPSGAFPTGTGAFTIEFWMNWGTGNPGADVPILLIDGNGTDNDVIFGVGYFTTVNPFLQQGKAGSPNYAYSLFTSTVINDGADHHIGIVRSGTTCTLYVDGASVGSITCNANIGARSYFGSPSTAPPVNTTDLLLSNLATYTTALSGGRIDAHNDAGRVSWAGDTSGARLTRIADLAAIPVADRAIDAGSTTLQATDLGGDALAYAQKIEETEAGRLFVAANGALTFISRYNAEIGTYLDSQATLVDADSGVGVGYMGASADVDESRIITRATVSREGSIAVTYGDPAAQAEFGILDEVHEGLLHDNDAYSARYAEFLVNTHNSPKTRLGTTTVEMSAFMRSGADPATILALELAARVTWKRKPQNTGDTIVEDMRVEAISHDTAGKTWRTSLQLSPFYLTGVQTGVWDDALWDQAAWGL